MKGLSVLCIVLAVIAATLFIPYIRFHLPPGGRESEFMRIEDEEDQLADSYYQSKDAPIVILAMLPLYYPLILLIESTLWADRKKWWKRVLLAVQGIAVILGGWLICFIMSFRLFSPPYDYLPMYYIIPVYLGIGVFWNILLAVPAFDRLNFLNKSFEKLSLRR